MWRKKKFRVNLKMASLLLVPVCLYLFDASTIEKDRL